MAQREARQVSNSEKKKYVHKPDRGALFKNEYKTKEFQPDYIGSYTTIDGTVRQIAGWINKTANAEYLSLSFSDPYEPKSD